MSGGWSYGLSLIGILSLWAAGRGQWWGWLIGAATQVPWIWYAVTTHQPGFIFSALIYGGIYLRNTYLWFGQRTAENTAPRPIKSRSWTRTMIASQTTGKPN